MTIREGDDVTVVRNPRKNEEVDRHIGRTGQVIENDREDHLPNIKVKFPGVSHPVYFFADELQLTDK